jgi:hypothetical protein
MNAIKETKFRPQPIKFKGDEYNLALSQYQKKIDTHNFIESILKTIDSTLEFSPGTDPVEMVYSFLQNSPQNIMNLTGERMAELKNINLDTLKNYTSQYNNVKHLKAPNIEDYTISTVNESQNKKLQAYNKFMKSYYEFIDSLPKESGFHNKWDFQKAFKRTIDFYNDQPTPTHEYLNS